MLNDPMGPEQLLSYSSVTSSSLTPELFYNPDSGGAGLQLSTTRSTRTRQCPQGDTDFSGSIQIDVKHKRLSGKAQALKSFYIHDPADTSAPFIQAKASYSSSHPEPFTTSIELRKQRELSSGAVVDLSCGARVDVLSAKLQPTGHAMLHLPTISLTPLQDCRVSVGQRWPGHAALRSKTGSFSASSLAAALQQHLPAGSPITPLMLLLGLPLNILRRLRKQPPTSSRRTPPPPPAAPAAAAAAPPPARRERQPMAKTSATKKAGAKRTARAAVKQPQQQQQQAPKPSPKAGPSLLQRLRSLLAVPPPIQAAAKAGRKAGRVVAAVAGRRLLRCAAVGYGLYEAVRGDYCLQVVSTKYYPVSGSRAGAVELQLADGVVHWSCEL